MNRAEKFALTVSIIGIADAVLSIVVSGIALAGAAVPVQEQAQQIVRNIPLVDTLKALAIFSLVYSWVAISWYLVRRYFLIWSERHFHAATSADQDEYVKIFLRRTWRTIIAIGILVSPLAALVEVGLLIFWPVGIPVVWVILAGLMPTIYPDEMDIRDLFNLDRLFDL